jgi:NADH-quinone oxidoreductase subunit C
METLEKIRDRLLARFPAATVTLVANPGPAAEHSLLLDNASARAIAEFLRDDEVLRLDYCSNVTGVDWPAKEIVETVRKTVPVEPAATEAAEPPSRSVSPSTMAVAGVADPGSPAAAAAPATKIIEEKIKRLQPGFLEVVYHLYSMARKHGPVVIRLRTANRTDAVTVPSLTPVWRAAEFQEREVFDLFGVVFDGHPDLRRILMWDGFKDHPMRKDYVAPDDFEWEPTPHADVLARAKTHYPAAEAAPATTSASAAAAGVADPAPVSLPPAGAVSSASTSARSAVNLTAPTQPGQVDRATTVPAAATPPAKQGGAA